MKLFDRYVVREFLPPILIGWSVLTGILLMQRIFILIDFIVNKRLPARLVLEILFANLPYIISYALPMGVLVAAIMVFGRLAQDYELVALRAAGISLGRVFLPLAAVGLLLTAGMVFFDAYLVPEANHRARELLTAVAKKRPTIRLRAATFSDDFEGYTIYIGRINERTGTIANAAIYQRRGTTTPTIITAPAGTMAATPDERYLTITLRDGEIHELVGETYRQLRFGRHTLNLPLDDRSAEARTRFRTDRELLLPQLGARIDSLDRVIGQLRREATGFARQAQAESLAGRGAQAAVARLRLRETRLRLDSQGRSRNGYLVEVHKKFALPFAVLLFVFFGAPLGALLRRGGLGPGFLAGLLFFTVYYVMLLGGEELADANHMNAAWAMWLPTVVLLVPALELFLRVFFERSLLRQ